MKQMSFFDYPDLVVENKPQIQVREVLCAYTEEQALLTDILGSQHAEKLFTAFPSMQLLLNASVEELATVVPQKIARKLQAIFNLSRKSFKDLPRIHSDEDVYKLMLPYAALDKEHFWVLTLDVRLHVTGIYEMYKGTIDAITSIRIAELLRPAIVMNATGIVLVHNHPSGDTSPSPQDIAFTKNFVAKAKGLDVRVNDHIIIGNGYSSILHEARHVFD
ncbi:MAG: JAB domain-containing protein [Anaerolineaceae bacterium]|jgi:DNA repair protein RadC|nr:JAB domain-containing protein [Anaerolineaceae bacterium]